MHVLVIGAGGFIGRHLAGRLMAEGVRVTAAGRRPSALARSLPDATVLACDLAQDDAAAWSGRLAGVDAVVNCAGVIGNGRDYTGVHDRGARALFDACRAAGMRRVVQVSALGAGAQAATAYHRSKAAADDHLASLDPGGTTMGWAVLRPSLVIGQGGTSSALFAAVAALPIVPRLGRHGGRVQPIHVDDLVAIVVGLLHRSGPMALRLDAVGPEPMTSDTLTLIVRRWLGLPATGTIPLPAVVLQAVARLGVGAVTVEGLAMLRAGNTAPVAPLIAATGHRPAPLAAALGRRPAGDAELRQARLAPLVPLLRLLLALVWLAGGIVPVAVASSTEPAAWLARIGLTGMAATAALWSGASADIAIGIALLARVRGAAVAGLALMATYTAILTLIAPELWADPLGPLVKNLAVLGLSLTVHALETRRG